MIFITYDNEKQGEDLLDPLDTYAQLSNLENGVIVAIDESSACRLIDAGLAYAEDWTEALPGRIHFFDFVRQQDVTDALTKQP